MKPASTLLVAASVAVAGILPAPASTHADDGKVDLQGEWTTDCLKIGKNDRHGIVTRITIRGESMMPSRRSTPATAASSPRCRCVTKARWMAG